MHFIHSYLEWIELVTALRQTTYRQSYTHIRFFSFVEFCVDGFIIVIIKGCDGCQFTFERFYRMRACVCMYVFSLCTSESELFIEGFDFLLF